MKRVVRLVAAVICLVAPLLGWVSSADAATTATVEVTGTVVDTALSLTLSTNAFSLGDVDATGTIYNPSTSIAEPFALGSNPYSMAQGLYWVAKQGFTFTVTSPGSWVMHFCSTTQSNVTDGSTSLLYLASARPPSGSDVPEYVGPSGVRPCSEGQGNGFGAPLGGTNTYDLFPTYLVRSTDTPHTFSATVQITVSAM